MRCREGAGVRHRHREKQRLRVGVAGGAAKILPLGDPPPRSGRGTSQGRAGDVLDDGEVVADKESARPSSLCRSWSKLTICAWTETSSELTGSSQTMNVGFDGECAGDADSLALAAGELCGYPLERVAWKLQPSSSSRSTRALAGRCRDFARPKLRIGSARISRTLQAWVQAGRTDPGTPPARALRNGSQTADRQVIDAPAVEHDLTGLSRRAAAGCTRPTVGLAAAGLAQPAPASRPWRC